MMDEQAILKELVQIRQELKQLNEKTPYPITIQGQPVHVEPATAFTATVQGTCETCPCNQNIKLSAKE